MRAIRQVEFAGEHFARGLRRGRMLRGTLEMPAAACLPEWFVQGCRAAAEAFYPPVAQAFEGMLEGCGFERRRLESYYFARLESRLGGCTMFAVPPGLRVEGAGPIVGRNYDWAVADLRWCELHRYVPQEGLRRIGYTHHWAGCPDLLNEAGLYLAIASLPLEPVRRPGVQWSILVDGICERCTTTAQAIAACGSVAHLRSMSYMLADAAGEVAVVEATPSGVRVRRAGDGFVAATNVPLGGEVMAEGASDPGGGTADAVWVQPGPADEDGLRRAEGRYAHARDLLERETPRLREDAVRRILADHEGPICTGDHARPDGGRWATIWSGICEPADGRFCIAPGLPCRHGYQTFRLDG